LIKSRSNIESLLTNSRRNHQCIMNILVCEDNIMTLKTIEHTLKKAGFKVYMAGDGFQGIKILDQKHIDLVITDINMPYTKGLELIRHINTKMDVKIPVMVISGITNSETRAHAAELGAIDYMTKPFNPRELVARVKAIMDQVTTCFLP